MSKNRNIFLLAFANDSQSSLRLGYESNECDQALAQPHDEGRIERMNMGWSTLDSIYQRFNHYNNQVSVFHFGGHSNSELILLKDAHASAKNLGKLIGQQKNLKLVFLNGCKNYDQVKVLLENGVPAVIATSADVGDMEAKVMAVQFYQALAGGKSILESYNSAAAFMGDQYKELAAFNNVDVKLRGEGHWSEIAKQGEFHWGLYPENGSTFDWKIPSVDEANTLFTLSGVNGEVYVDHSHDQKEWHGLTSLILGMDSTTSFIENEPLESAGVIVIPLPFHKDLSEYEISRLQNWVQRKGGGLLILGYYSYTHHETNISNLTQKWGISIDDNMILPNHISQDRIQRVLNDYSEDVGIAISPHSSHPITEGIDSIVLNLSCSISIQNSSLPMELVINSPSDSNLWLPQGPLNGKGHRLLIPGYDQGSGQAPVLVAFKDGLGKVAICGSLQVFRDHGDNRKLLKNLIDWLRPSQ